MKKYDVKQVIVIRRDLKMRRGKEIAQGSHASQAFAVEYLKQVMEGKTPQIAECVKEWITNGTAKITLQVDTEKELVEIYRAAKNAGIFSYLITDSGHTEFHLVPTKTAVAIGPDYSDKIDKLTGKDGQFNIKLY